MGYKNCEDLTVVIPTRNEANNIGLLIDGLMGNYPGINIIISDDGSTDGTIKAIKDKQEICKNITLIDRKNEDIKGLTVSVLDAIDHVKTKYFIVMDGDGQHDAECIKLIYEKLKENNKICTASRGYVEHWPFQKKAISYIGAFLGKMVLFLMKKKYPKDILSGFFGVDTGYWRDNVSGARNGFSPEGYKILFDFLKIRRSNDKIVDVYYLFNPRHSGSSKINTKVYFEFLKSCFRKIQ